MQRKSQRTKIRRKSRNQNIDSYDLKEGNHIFSYQIPNAQPTTDKFWNHWNVSFYLTYEN